MLILTYLSLRFSKSLAKESLNKGDISNVEYANDAFLPSYLGYFFVALDVPNTETLWFVYPLIFVFTFLDSREKRRRVVVAICLYKSATKDL